MTALELFYATNRKHKGRRWTPTGYDRAFSEDGMENLRFGALKIQDTEGRLETLSGGALEDYLHSLVPQAAIQAYREDIKRDRNEESQVAVLGSGSFFADLQRIMSGGTDVVVFIHGFNVSWESAVASAIALQVELNRVKGAAAGESARVVLFTWPSDGLKLPWVSYKSDRSEATGSGNAVGRAFLRFRDFLIRLRRGGEDGLCNRNIHLLCHSMGNYVLQSVLLRMDAHTPGDALPRLFEHIFLCAPDVDDDVLEPGRPLGRLQELGSSVTVYYNCGDRAMFVSDYTKGNPERLGTNGAARPKLLHNKVLQVDCRLVAGDGPWIQHSYYAMGLTLMDIRQSLDGLSAEAPERRRERKPQETNVWRLMPE